MIPLGSRFPPLDASGAEVVFTATDGYVATMALDDALAADGVVAVRDLDAPAGQDLQTFLQGKTTTTPAPYYLVWPKQDPNDWAYPWPYQLATIAVEPFALRFGRAASKMPSFAGLLKTAEIDRVLDYLAFMATRKNCTDAAACKALVE